MRTEEERKQQMQEAVVSILEAAVTMKATHTDDYRTHPLKSETLVQLHCAERILWEKSSLKR